MVRILSYNLIIFSIKKIKSELVLKKNDDVETISTSIKRKCSEKKKKGHFSW